MDVFNTEFAKKIAMGKEALEAWIVEMDNKMRYTECTQAESNALKRRMRIVRDYIDYQCKLDADADDDPPVRNVEP